MKVLVVDDSGSMRKIIASILFTHAGISHCDEASDGKKAITAICRNKYDLILMDWNMPKMTGLEAVKIIRNLGKTMPIIMVTTNAEKGQLVKALKAGVNNYIVKPFTPEILMAKFRETMSKAQQTNEPKTEMEMAIC
ncbi:MAG: response regulator [Candidatus Omnitrophota bacterium]|jgi:two-component system chemotaxis response regulator CheY|nr:MAG: response regulator [Candidatus Omnitrophota bacterium]